MGVLFLVLILALVAAIGYLQYRSRQARINGVAALGARINFAFSRDDADGVAYLPFTLFQQGKGRKASLVLTGKHNDVPLRLFDYEYYIQGDKSREYHRFTCGVLTIPAACPPLRLAHENFMTRIGDHLVHHDVKLEYDDFNRRFVVNCEEQKFAFTLLDGQMMQWLLDADGVEHFEIVGPFVLIAKSRLDPSRWLELGNWLDDLHKHIPPLLYTAYPPQ